MSSEVLRLGNGQYPKEDTARFTSGHVFSIRIHAVYLTAKPKTKRVPDEFDQTVAIDYSSLPFYLSELRARQAEHCPHIYGQLRVG